MTFWKVPCELMVFAEKETEVLLQLTAAKLSLLAVWGA